MTGPVPLFQLDPADLFKLRAIPRDDENEPLLFVRQHDPFLFVRVSSPSRFDDLDGVGSSTVGRRLKHRTRGSGRLHQVPRNRVQGVGAEISSSRDVLAPGRRKDKGSRWRDPDGIATVVVRVEAYTQRAIVSKRRRGRSTCGRDLPSGIKLDECTYVNPCSVISYTSTNCVCSVTYKTDPNASAPE